MDSGTAVKSDYTAAVFGSILKIHFPNSSVINSCFDIDDQGAAETEGQPQPQAGHHLQLQELEI